MKFKHTKHTKGLWQVSTSNPTRVIVCKEKQIDDICVAATFGDAYDDDYESCVANARLIAAAPKLLQALVAIVKAWESVPEDVRVPDEINTDALWIMAHKAIKKAK